MTKPPAKRISLLGNTEKRNVGFRRQLEDTGACVPIEVWAAFEIVEEKAQKARDYFLAPEGEEFVESAASAQTVFFAQFIKPGLGSMKGGWNNQYLHGGFTSTSREQVVEYARPLVPKERPLPWGAKQRVAEEVAKHFHNKNIDDIRKTLRKSDVYD